MFDTFLTPMIMFPVLADNCCTHGVDFHDGAIEDLSWFLFGWMLVECYAWVFKLIFIFEYFCDAICKACKRYRARRYIGGSASQRNEHHNNGSRDQENPTGIANQRDPRLHKYSSLSEDSKTTKDCAICTEKFNDNTMVIQLSCSNKHIFHTACVKKWLREKASCPICRLPANRV